MDLQASVAMDLGIRVGVAQKTSEFPLSPAETTSLSLSLSIRSNAFKERSVQQLAQAFQAINYRMDKKSG